MVLLERQDRTLWDQASRDAYRSAIAAAQFEPPHERG
jgi:hypothetical protein